jgi:hypothetical protein
MGGGELLRVGLLPELIDLRMHWGEVILDYEKYEKEDMMLQMNTQMRSTRKSKKDKDDEEEKDFDNINA